jgi:type II secretory pathway pseudopilin PulG
MQLDQQAAHGPRRARRAGVTLIEVLISMIVLLVAVGGMLGSISSFALLAETSREKALALAAAQRTLEQMQLASFDEVFVRFNDTAADDPAAGASPGPGFAVEALEPRAGDADGMPGRVVFPVDPAFPGVLREDLADADFGMPRDLDGDGVQDAANRAGDYAVLPVRVVIEWGGTNDGALELQALLRSNQ